MHKRPAIAAGDTQGPAPSSNAGRSSSADAAPPSSSVGASVRGAIDSLVQGSLVELFQAYGVAVAPRARSTREQPLSLPDVSSTISFTVGGDPKRTGRLTLSMPAAVLGLMKGDLPAKFRDGDWARELVNQLMGRIKNRMLQFSVRLQAGLPSNIDSKLLDNQLQSSPAMRAYAGRTMRGEVVVTLEGLPHESELVYLGPGSPAQEGDVLWF